MNSGIKFIDSEIANKRDGLKLVENFEDNDKNWSFSMLRMFSLLIMSPNI